MAYYETLFVVHPDQGGKMKEWIDKFKRVIEGLDGKVSQVEEWGLRDLAYPIEKQAKGYYTLIQYSSSARTVEELERNMKLTDGLLRYITVRLEEEPKAAARAVHGAAPAAGSTEPQPKTEMPS